MRDHIVRSHRQIPSENKLFQPPITMSKPYLRESTQYHTCTQAVISFVIGARLPISIVDNHLFRRLIATLDPRYSGPCSSTLRTAIAARSLQVQEDFKSRCKAALAISFTLDAWTQHRRSFIVITSHFVNNSGSIAKGIAGIIEMSEKHTASAIQARFFEKLSKLLDQPIEAILAPQSICYGITTDNASNMKLFGCSSGLVWQPCIVHKINLWVKDVVSTDAISNVFDKARGIVLSFRCKQRYIEALKMHRLKDEKQKQLLS